MRVLVLGAGGLLGNAIFRVLSEREETDSFGTVRSRTAERLFASALAGRLVLTEDLENLRELAEVLDAIRPTVVINCTALKKSSPADPLRYIALYSVFPQRLWSLCRARNLRLVQISSDAVFSGSRGNYSEVDIPDANDLYGISKLLGEIHGPHAITIRTSVIGPELESRAGLLEWFLSQQGECKCHARAVFSGLPSVVLAQIIRDIILNQENLHGIYHVGSKPITKCDLLRLIAERYGKRIHIQSDDRVVIDRSLNSDRFAATTGYIPPDWPSLIDIMRSYKVGLAGA